MGFEAGFEALNMIRGIVELRAVARNYIMSGGTREAWINAFDEAHEELRGAGHAASVRQDQSPDAGAPQADAGGEGPGASVREDHTQCASSAGAEVASAEARASVSARTTPSMPPARDAFTPPKDAPVPPREITGGDIAAMMNYAKEAYQEKIRNKPLGSYSFDSLKNNVRSINAYENRLIGIILEWRNDHHVLGSDLVTKIPEKDLRKMIERARRGLNSAVAA